MSRLATIRLVAAIVMAYVPARICSSAEGPSKLPEFVAVQSAIESSLQGNRDYAPGDLITRGQVTAALDAAVKQTGWRLDAKKREALLKATLDDRSFLVEQLTSKRGRPFMRKIAEYQLSFDVLDRLSQLPQGRSTVQRLAAGPGGDELIEYLTSENGGRELEQMLAKAPGGAGFGKATGKIYDAEQLLSVLRKEHSAAKRAAAQQTR